MATLALHALLVAAAGKPASSRFSENRIAPAKPHVMMLLADDYGWANAGWHRKELPGGETPEVQTPVMDALVAEGIELDQAYSFKFCSPTRSALQSGRFPTHVNVLNDDMDIFNPKDPVSGFAGIPRNMTGMATHMKAGGYATHQTGKWDAGMATPDHTPQGRGYDTSLGYFHHANDYWTEHVGAFVDLWETDAPAHTLNGTKDGSFGTNGTVEDYEEFKFLTFVLDTIQAHDPNVPLFYNYDFHIVHEPLEVPAVYHEKFDFIANSEVGDFEGHRQTYTSMVNFMDGAVGNITDLLKSKGMYDDTIIFFQSDNGGPSFSGSSHTANNWPLKGTKMHNWQGGIRVNAWVSGGLIKTQYPHMVGTKLEGLVSIADWYATVAGIAGVDPTDHRAAAAGLPPIDGLNMMPYFTGEVDKSPRTFIFNDVNTAVIQINDTLWKIITGEEGSACWMGPQYPNASGNPGCDSTVNCGDGCLYNLDADPTEHDNVAAAPENKATLTYMQNRLAEMNKGFFSPDRKGGNTAVATNAAKEKYGGFWGPFLP
jgi:arylsulfatase I/J